MDEDNIFPTNPIIIDRDYHQEFAVDLQRASNAVISFSYPLVSVMTLKSIVDELNESIKSKKHTLDKLRKKYRHNNLNVIHDVIIDDVEMYNSENLRLFTGSQSELVHSVTQPSMLQIIFKQIEDNVGKNSDPEFQEVYNFIHLACNNNFTKLSFENSNQTSLDPNTVYRIIQVWQVFEQYFKQFDYPDYLDHYNEIRFITKTGFVADIIELLVKAGPISC